MAAYTSSSAEKTFGDHLLELRTRLMISAFCVAIGAIGAYFYNNQILAFLVRPLGGPLYYTTPTGGFDLVFKISLLGGVFISSPVLVYQILAFLEPVIPKKTDDSIRKFLFSSWILLITGAAVAYYLSLPAALRLLNDFGSTQVKAIISTKEYFSFIISYLGGFALVFQLPIIILLVNKITPLKPKSLSKYLRHVVLLSFMIAAVLTPTPDPINQTVMAAPMILLYVISIVGVWFVNLSRNPKEEKYQFFPVHGALLLLTDQISNNVPREGRQHYRYLR